MSPAIRPATIESPAMRPASEDPTELDLLVLGDVNPDLVLTGEDLTPAFGQVEQLLQSASLTIGGSGAIMACGAARLGLRTAVAGVVGDDLFGFYMSESLAARGVDISGVVVAFGAATGLTVILARPEDRAILTFPGTAAALTGELVAPGLLRRARHVHAASFFLQTALAPELGRIFEEVHAAGATTSLDPNWDPQEVWEGGLTKVLASTDVFLPNAEEAQRIAGRPEPAAAAHALARSARLVAVKLGAAGALAAAGEAEPIRVAPPVGAVPVDTVGAGDSFDAGLLAGLLRGEDVERALALGCACGALSTRAAGGTTAQPTLEEAVVAISG
jgi:sugar/nucleoside kinase (ribokinase family)